MKSILRWAATAGLVTGALASTFAMGVGQVLAIPQEKILEKIKIVPMFTIANDQGAPLVASAPDGKGPALAGAFISHKDAQAFLQNLKTNKPDLAKGVQVVPVSMAEVFQLNQGKTKAADALGFAYVPSPQQLDYALNIIKQKDQKAQRFAGAPLFVALGGKDKEKGYLTIQQGQDVVIPMFFKKEELQALLDRFKQQQPDLANSLEIQVLPLEGLMEVMQTKNDPQLSQIVLIPPQESIEYVRALAGQQGGAAQPKKK
jgi:DNA-binding TFAR19-related protein (PDSD5 family)